MRALVTSGPTRAPLDATRFLMTTSTGALGAALAAEGVARGWQVDLVRGWSAQEPAPHPLLTVHPVNWLDDLVPLLERLASARSYAVVFHAMAVLDYAPTPLRGKRPSGSSWDLTLHPTPKVIDRMKNLFPQATLIGFKLETEIPESLLVERAAALARRSGARAVVANLLEWTKGGYRCCVVDERGCVLARPEGRAETASWLWRFVLGARG